MAVCLGINGTDLERYIICNVPLNDTSIISGLYTTLSGQNSYATVHNSDQTAIEPPYVMGTERDETENEEE